MAKFFVKGTTAKVTAALNNAEYDNSIILDTEKHIIYHNREAYGITPEVSTRINSLEDALAALKYFSIVAGNTGSASASSANATLNIKGDGTVITSTVSSNGVTIAAADMKAATSTAAGTHGLVPAPAAGKLASFLRGDGTWVVPTNTDTKVTSAANHYTPVADSAAALTVTAGKYVSGVTRDAKGHVVGLTETALPAADTLVSGTANGTVAFNGTDVAVKGLGSAAYTETSAYATAAQGTKADNAVPKTTTVNSKALSSNITLSGADIALTGYTVGSNAAIVASDTINTAFGKAQAQIDTIKNTAVGAMHFVGVVTTLPSSANAGDVYIKDGKEYVWDDKNERFEEFGDQSLMGQLQTDVATLKDKPGLDKVGTVTSVGVSMPTGFSVANSPVSTSGTIAVTFASGYSLPTTAKQTAWDNKVSFPGYATVAPKANGTAAVGTSTKVAREDHVHPLQTSVSGNAGTATKLATARTISLGNDLTGSASFDGSANITISASIEWEEL